MFEQEGGRRTWRCLSVNLSIAKNGSLEDQYYRYQGHESDNRWAQEVIHGVTGVCDKNIEGLAGC